MIFTTLSYFDKVIGPKIFLVIPKITTPININHIAILMDLYKEGFFVQEFGKFKSASFIFKIFSPLARANKERIMISIISIYERYNLNLGSFKEILEFFVSEFKEIKDLYKIFHFKNISGAFEKYREVVNFVYSFHQSLPKKRAIIDQKISKILTYGLSPLGKSIIINSLQEKFSQSRQRIREISLPSNFVAY